MGDVHLTQESFRSEIQTFQQIAHLNLVGFYGYLEYDNEQIIVVEYVPNGNLRQHLDGNFTRSASLFIFVLIKFIKRLSLAYILVYNPYTGVFGKILDFATRLDIAIDVAHAITYLHTYCGTSI